MIVRRYEHVQEMRARSMPIHENPEKESLRSNEDDQIAVRELLFESGNPQEHYYIRQNPKIKIYKRNSKEIHGRLQNC